MLAAAGRIGCEIHDTAAAGPHHHLAPADQMLQMLDLAGSVVISCQTPSGTLEFAMARPDVKPMLHVLQRGRVRGRDMTTAGLVRRTGMPRGQR